jgi:TPR repeat protein
MVDTRRIALAGALAALLLGAFGGAVVRVGVVGAETSSWTGRVDPAEAVEKSPQKAPPKAPKASVPIIKAVPVTAEGGKAPVVKPPTTAKGKPEAGGEADPAYEAFEQGRYLTALKLAVKGAERGEPQAHTLVGRIYSEGLGVALNAPLAAQWFARAAELGDPEGMFAYAMLLAQGRGVAKDRVQAGRLFEQAAAKKHLLANYNLALLYMRGDGKPENPHRALLHMRYAAENGVVTAQYDLGTMYATGLGTDANAFEAAKWIGKAAAAGHPEAQVDYAVMLFRGHGVPTDAKKGAEYFRRAAEKGLATAQNRLARCYTHGAGVPQSLVEAAKWNYIAKAGGIEDDALDAILARQLSRADEAKAQAAAQLWRDRIAVGLD